MLASMTDILYNSDSFWEHMTVDSLRNIMSASKEFHSEMRKANKSTAGCCCSLLEFSLLAMIKNRPHAFNGWKMRFSTASNIFFLSIEQLIGHCAALPAADPFHIGVDNVDDWMLTGSTPSAIRFIDAFRLAVNGAGGLKGVMECRDRLRVKVMASAHKILVSVGDRFEQMSENAERASGVLEQALADLLQDVENDGNIDGTPVRSSHEESTLRKGIRRLKKLKCALEIADMDYHTIKYIVEVAAYKNITSLQCHVGEVGSGLRLLVPRYKSYSVKYCKGSLPLHCLPEMK
jgi:hypothetical protein